MALARVPQGEPIPGYRLLEPLGRGGFGQVWKCEAPGGLLKALKFVDGNLNALDVDGVRAEQELHALDRIKSIRHPFILSIERVEIVQGELLIVMELADKNLLDRAQECQKAGQPGIPRDELIAFLSDAAEALDVMNFQYDLQHLDIKPRNLFVVSNRVKVADFGLVKDLEGMSSGGGLLAGGVTPLYAAPETFQGIISRHSDQYSLAVVYQELLTGTWPFKGKTPRQLALQHTQEEPDLSPLLPADRPVVAKALAKNPQDRFPSCLDFVRALASGLVQSQGGEGLLAKGSQILRRPVFGVSEDLLAATNSPLLSGSGGANSPGPLTFEEAARLSVTVAQPATGSLRPALVIGLGKYGAEALQALRCRVIDRFGTLAKLPLLRFLCIDSDAETLNAALLGPPEQALSNNEVFHLPLQGIAHFRRNRQALEQVTEWLPLEKLYAVPRSLETDGSRAMGRLAFTDNYNRLASRLRRELQLCSNPENLDRSVQETGLAIRSDIPQVYVMTTAGGGTGSGVLLDLGYLLRRLLHELGQANKDVVSLLMCGAPSDPATPGEELANLHATLTEINHFSDPAVEFVAKYNANGPMLRDPGPPFQAVYLLRLGHRSPEGLKQTAARMASYVFHDLSTPLGTRLTHSREVQTRAQVTPFRSFGAYAVWFPRGLMLRVAARLGCQRLIDAWQNLTRQEAWQGLIEEACADLFGSVDWKPEVLQRRIELAAATPGEGTPAQALTTFLATLETQAEHAVSRDDPASWCHQAIERIRDWVGSGVSAVEETSEWRKSRLHRLFAAAVQKVADECVEQLAKPAQQMFDRPGYRLAAAEAVYERLLLECQAYAESQKDHIQELTKQTEKCWRQVDQAVDACLRSGSFVLFAGKRMHKLLLAFVDRLAAYARQRLVEENCRALQAFYIAIQGRIQDLQRDLAFCRQRLRHMQESLLAAPGAVEQDLADEANSQGMTTGSQVSSSQMLRDAATVLASRIVLPGGVSELDHAAGHFMDRVTTAEWLELDEFLQAHVLTPLGGLHRVCMTSSDLTRTLGTPLLDGAAEFLGKLLPVTDVCEAELSATEALSIDLPAQFKAYYHLARPYVTSRRTGKEEAYLLLPLSTAGRRVGQAAKEALEKLHVVPVANHTDLLFCREQGGIGLEDLQDMLEPCRAAYEQAATTPLTTPHARCDILDWVPLDA
jgi:serine/threonine protein kinase